jgi:uncharacterized protein (DUF433 family)
MTDGADLFGRGIYDVAETARLTGVSRRRIVRWMQGYDFAVRDGSKRHSDPVWRGDLAPIDGIYALSFRDLVEVRFIDGFRRAGVSWPTIRAAAAEACDILKTSHPFATRRFQTDGRAIYAKLEAKLLELGRRQFAFQQIVDPSLFVGLEYRDDQLARWRPHEGRNLIVLDPVRSFGRPIADRSGVPTFALAAAAAAEGEDQVARIARWLDATPAEVQAAVAYERFLDERRGGAYQKLAA